jgi:hypothetical protein
VTIAMTVSTLPVSNRLRQQGSALTVAIILLLLMTIAIFVAVPSILGEQRVSGNDVRAKIAQHVAEAGLNHGREFLRLNSSDLIVAPLEPIDFTKWVACSATDRQFPCGTVETDLATSALRSRHYRYIGGADGRTVSFSPARMYDGTGNDAGNFNASYDVGVLLCRMTVTNDCTTSAASTTSTSMYTLVSRGSVTGESTTATVSETIGTYRIVNLSTNIPPVMAAGTITGLGNSTIVGNPNAGGFGVPLSIWARNNFDGSGGSWQTCQLEEYLRSDLTGVLMEGKGKNVATCEDCACTVGNRLSDSSMAVEGKDILDSVDADLGLAKAGTPYYYPCDMFEYVLGVRAREPSTPGGVCDTMKDTEGVIGVDDIIEWLTANADIQQCDELNSESAGIIWVQSACTGGDALTGRIGSPDNPVVLIVDGDLKLNTNVQFFGMVFLRYMGTDFADCISTGAGCPELEPGGGGAQIYGSLVMEGGGKINGTVDIVYLPQLVQIFNESPANNRFAGLPGSWSDRVAY